MNRDCPQLISIDDSLRLRRFDGVYDFALKWYSDEELVYLVDGKRNRYDYALLKRMYDYLDKKGELYFIEVRTAEGFVPIGDVTLCNDDLPIVIGDSRFRDRGIGRRVLSALIDRALELDYDHLGVEEIYSFNHASEHCFSSVGFTAYRKTERGWAYRLELGIERILIYHVKRFPLMQPADCIKLLYQNEFGGGHLVSDSRASQRRLLEELATVAPDERIPFTVPIGNGLVRVNLAAGGLSPEQLNEAFVSSSRLLSGNLESFKTKLDVLQKLVGQGAFAFSPAELSDYLSAYAAAGYPMASHSETYRAAYRPAYRVVLQSQVN